MPISLLIILGSVLFLLLLSLSLYFWFINFKESFILTKTIVYNPSQEAQKAREFRNIQSNHAFHLVHMTEKQGQSLPRIIYVFTESDLKTRFVLLTNKKNVEQNCIFTARDSTSFFALEKLVHSIPHLQQLFIHGKGTFMAPQENRDLSILDDSQQPIIFGLFLKPREKIPHYSNRYIFDYINDMKRERVHVYDQIAFIFPLCTVEHVYMSDIFDGHEKATHIDYQYQYEIISFDFVFFTQNTLSFSHEIQNALEKQSLDSEVNSTALNFYRQRGYPIFPIESFSKKTISPIRFEINTPLSYMERTFYPVTIPLKGFRIPFEIQNVPLAPKDRIILTHQVNTFENGSFKVIAVNAQKEECIIVDGFYFTFLDNHCHIRTITPDKKDVYIVIKPTHPQWSDYRNIIEKGDIVYVSEPFHFHGYVDSLQSEVVLHIFDEEERFYEKYECVGDPERRSKKACETTYTQSGKRLDKSKYLIWDRPCVFDHECPFFEENRRNRFDQKRYYRGGCQENGYCELPLNVIPRGFRAYVDSESSFPYCQECQSINLTRENMEACCKHRAKKHDSNIFAFHEK